MKPYRHFVLDPDPKKNGSPIVMFPTKDKADEYAARGYRTIAVYAESDVKALIDFVRDCRDNWDCDPDAHRYNTTCRACEAEKLLNETT